MASGAVASHCLHTLQALVLRLSVLQSPQLVSERPHQPAYHCSWRSVFAWHTEDVDLFSLNLLHFGAPKFWYSVGPEHAGRLEQLAAAAFPDVLKETRCRRFLRHKTTMLSPEQLKKAGIPFVRAIQRPGEIMLTYAGAYHAGFNTGFNCAESANFVAPLWWPQGEKAVHSMCICRPDHVRINLAALRQAVEEFQHRGGEREWSAAGCAPTARAGAAAASGRSQSAVCGADMAGLTRDSSSGGGSDGGASSPKPWLAGHAMSIAPGLARELSWPELPRSTLDLGSADEFGGFVRFRANVIDSGEWNWSQRAEDGMLASRPALAEPLGRSQIRVAKCLPGAVESGAEPSVSGTGRGAGSPLRQLLAKLEPWRARLLRETLAYCAADPVPMGSKGARPGQRAAAGPPAVWVQWTDGSMFSGWAIEYGSGSVRVHYPGYRRTEDEWHGIDDDAIAARADPSDYCWRRPAGWMAASSFMEVTVAKGKGTPGDLGTERDRAAQDAASQWAAQPGPKLGAEAFADRPPDWRNMLWRVRVRPSAKVTPETSWSILEPLASLPATDSSTMPQRVALQSAAGGSRQPKRPRSPAEDATSAPLAGEAHSRPEAACGAFGASACSASAPGAAGSLAKRTCAHAQAESTPVADCVGQPAAASATYPLPDLWEPSAFDGI